MPSFTRSVSRTEFEKLALPMLVGRYILIGLPKNLPAGLEKSRKEGRRLTGSVSTTVGAEGSSEAALSGAEVPAPGTCWAYPDEIPATHARRTATTAHNSLRPA